MMLSAMTGSLFLQKAASICPYAALRSFGETVTWSGGAQKPIRTRRQADLITGVLQNGKTYVKIRDFEKLGYQVGYSYDQDTRRIPTISK